VGRIMNSCMASLLPAWEPPLMTFNAGTGEDQRRGCPPRSQCAASHGRGGWGGGLSGWADGCSLTPPGGSGGRRGKHQQLGSYFTLLRTVLIPTGSICFRLVLFHLVPQVKLGYSISMISLAR